MQTTTTENVTGLPEMHRRMVWRADIGGGWGLGGKNGMWECKGKRLGCAGLDRQRGGREIRGGGRKSVGCRGGGGISGMWVCGGK